MTHSESYLVAEEKTHTFVTKMNFSGDTSIINTEAKMLSWISANLTSTDFASLLEAETEWEDIKDLRYVIYQENEDFYHFIQSDEDRYIKLLQETNSQSSGCGGSCLDNYTSCNSYFSGLHAQATISLANDFDNHNISAQQFQSGLAVSHAILVADLLSCLNTYHQCCGQ